ncbi:MAG: hypothetical protein IJ191_02725 [Treponema sp.]|nr:hypothetical protein [Treponema sp.]
MDVFRAAAIAAVLLLVVPSAAPADETLHGRRLSDSIFALLQSAGVSPEKQDVVESGSNRFPYNITVTFATAETSPQSSGERTTLIMAFAQEEADTHRAMVTRFLEAVSRTPLRSELVLLFSVGNEPNGARVRYAVSGTAVFAARQSDPDSAASICVSFAETASAYINPWGENDASPPQLIAQLGKAFSDCGVPFRINGGIGGIFRRVGTGAAAERLSAFLQAGIPGAGIIIGTAVADETAADLLMACTARYDGSSLIQWERHYVPVQIGNRFFFIGERCTIICFIIVTAIALAVLVSNGAAVRSVWASAPGTGAQFLGVLFATYSVSFCIFETSQLIVGIVQHCALLFPPVLFTLKIAAAFITHLLAYNGTLHMKWHFVEPYWWHVLIAAVSVTVLLSIFIDITLFFVFAIECCVVILLRTVRHPAALIIQFFLILIPIAPFVWHSVSVTDSPMLRTMLSPQPLGNALLTVLLLPLYLQWFRISSSLRVHWNREHTPAHRYCFRVPFEIAVLVSGVLLAAVGGAVLYRAVPHSAAASSVVVVSDGYPQISVEERTAFQETIRTVSIDLGADAAWCDVHITGTTMVPIVHSENEYSNDSAQNTSAFIIPSWPPETMVFRYIPNGSEPADITVTARYTADNRWTERTAHYTILPESQEMR